LIKKISIFLLFFFSLAVFSFAQSHDNHQSDNIEDEGQLDIISKVVDHDYVDFYFFGKLYMPKFPPVHLGSVEIDFSPTKSLFMMFVSSIIITLILFFAARSNKKNKVPKGLGNLIEVFIVFIRDEIVIPNMGKEGVKHLPLFLTLFFFILTCNLIGLVPFMAQPTKNISVTTALALVTFLTTQGVGIKKNGFFGYVKNLIPPGVPLFVAPIMAVVEFIGLFTKPFALLMRLFANITAGSIIILSLIGLIFMMSWAGVAIAVPFALFINLLEIFIAFLQAYIFTMLSVLFISMAAHPH